MHISWFSDNIIEIFGVITGILYVFLEIKQKPLLWPVGIVTSSVYIWVFFTSKLYADMSLQVYYVIISVLGWYWWIKGSGPGADGTEQGGWGKEHGDVKESKSEVLKVTHIRPGLAAGLTAILIVLYTGIYLALSRLTDSTVPAWDAFITALSIIATWMLARKIYEHWYLWIVVNAVTIVLCIIKGLYPTVALYTVYLVMSFAGLYQWRKSLT